jgi:hypothetical protein
VVLLRMCLPRCDCGATAYSESTFGVPTNMLAQTLEARRLCLVHGDWHWKKRGHRARRRGRPARAITGIDEWCNVRFEVRSVPALGKDTRSHVWRHLRNSTGNAWFDKVGVPAVAGKAGPAPQ